ncbi:MAG: hypothetical protein ABWX61_07495, partial [Paenisporosarcina sp.]
MTNIMIFVINLLITYTVERLIVCPHFEVQLPGLKKNSNINRFGRQEFLVYVTPRGKKKSTIVQCSGNGKALIKRISFDCCEIVNVEIDFINSICSFESNSKLDDQIPALLKNILSGFLIQYHSESIAFFT